MVEIEAIVIVTVSQMIVLHLVPPKPVPVQLHEKAPRRLVQLPPLEQGFDAHSSISWPPDKFDLIFVADVNVWALKKKGMKMNKLTSESCVGRPKTITIIGIMDCEAGSSI